MRLVEYFERDMAAAVLVDHRVHVFRYWRRAIEETLIDRALSNVTYPHSRNVARTTVRYMPFWLTIPIDQIIETQEALDKHAETMTRT